MKRSNTFKTKIVRTGSALALLIGATMTVVTPAAARPWGWHHGWGWGGAVAAGVIGSALAAATSPFWAPGYYHYGYPYYRYPGYAYEPTYTYGYGTYAYEPTHTYRAYAYEPETTGGIAYCEAHFHSYNPATETYLGYDGRYHHCS